MAESQVATIIAVELSWLPSVSMLSPGRSQVTSDGAHSFDRLVDLIVFPEVSSAEAQLK